MSNQDKEYQRFLDLLPIMYETAAEITEQRIKDQISAIVVDEFGDSQVAVEYINSFFVESVNPERRIVSFTPASDRIKSIETGIRPFSIKERMLSKKSKISKDGYRYRVIPISKDEGKTSSNPTAKERQVRDQIREIVEGSRFSLQFAATEKSTGAYHVQDRAGGRLIRQRSYSSKEAYHNKQEATRTRYVIFRTMSERPGTSQWQHPGTQGKSIVSRVEQWQNENDRQIFDETVDNLFDLYFGDTL